MHKQVFLSRDSASALDFPVAPLAGAASPAIESIIAVPTSFGRAVVSNRIPAGEAETWARGLRHVANDHRYYELTHESLAHQFEHYYLLLQDRSGATRGISVLIFDEFHERHLEGDIALARAREIQRTTRPDLKIIVMSATLESGAVDRISEALSRCSSRAGKMLIPSRLSTCSKADDAPIVATQAAEACERLLVHSGKCTGGRHPHLHAR